MEVNGFGLTKRNLAGVPVAPETGFDYASPQSLAGEMGASADLFALGIVLFRVYCGWRFPRRDQDYVDVPAKGGRTVTVPREVAKAFKIQEAQRKGEPSEVLCEYSDANWQPEDRFKISDLTVTAGIKEIIYGMISFDPGKKYSSAKSVKLAFGSSLDRLR